MKNAVKELSEKDLKEICGGGLYKRIYQNELGEMRVRIYWKNE